MINQIIEAYSLGKRVKIILITKEEIRLYSTYFTNRYGFGSDLTIEYDDDNLYLITGAGLLHDEKTRVISDKSIFEVVIS